MYGKEKIKPQVRFVITLYFCAYPAMIDKLNDLTAKDGGRESKGNEFCLSFLCRYLTIPCCSMSEECR